MGKNAIADPPNFKKYGVPFYSVSWIPQNLLKSQQNQTTDEASDAADSSTPPGRSGEHYLTLAGGGGEGRSGIPNAVLIAHFDVASNSLSDQPVAKLGTDSELPYRMTLHPSGEGLICAMPNSCRWFEWDENKSAEIHKLGLKSSEKVLTQLEDVGQQLALAFNNDGTTLAVGGEDGNLRVFKWPSMEIILNETKAHSTVKDLNFSSDGKLLVSLGSGGPCRVWELSSSTVLTSISSKNREIFSSCRFSQINDRNHVLYIAAMTDKGGSILTWDTKTGEMMGSKHIIRDAISALNVSADGKFLACGTPSGDVVIVSSTNMQIHTTIKKAHLGIVTALAFSPDSRALASVSLDSSARVTLIEEKRKSGMCI
ncbi:SEC12-like protein 2 [Senna tora]|uniref:SEC12-like protein 2 n=1 Tax=Senna tora TaxID=362788 RepID=A0A834TT18_9FABA|nr:SEC12-like protein 2 [Senna tora]